MYMSPDVLLNEEQQQLLDIILDHFSELMKARQPTGIFDYVTVMRRCDELEDNLKDYFYDAEAVWQILGLLRRRLHSIGA